MSLILPKLTALPISLLPLTLVMLPAALTALMQLTKLKGTASITEMIPNENENGNKLFQEIIRSCASITAYVRKFYYTEC